MAGNVHTREKDLDTARKLLASSLFNDSAKEGGNAYRQVRVLIKRHGLKYDELVSRDGKPLSLQDLMAAGDKIKDVVGTVRSAIVDPDVQRGIDSILGLVRSGTEIVRKVRKR